MIKMQDRIECDKTLTMGITLPENRAARAIGTRTEMEDAKVEVDLRVADVDVRAAFVNWFSHGTP
jgi:hypothetical protein